MHASAHFGPSLFLGPTDFFCHADRVSASNGRRLRHAKVDGALFIYLSWLPYFTGEEVEVRASFWHNSNANLSLGKRRFLPICSRGIFGPITLFGKAHLGLFFYPHLFMIYCEQLICEDVELDVFYSFLCKKVFGIY